VVTYLTWGPVVFQHRWEGLIRPHISLRCCGEFMVAGGEEGIFFSSVNMAKIPIIQLITLIPDHASISNQNNKESSTNSSQDVFS